MNIDDKIQDGHAALDRLAAIYRNEHDGAQWTRRADIPAVNSSGRSDPTGQTAVVNGRERRARQIEADIRWAVDRLEEKVDRHKPKITGNCTTDGCIRDGITTWHGRCTKCGPWINRNPGFDPADMTDPDTGRSLVDDWNRTATRDCGCPGWCCPDGCLERIRPDGTAPRTDQPISDKCRKRMQRIRETSNIAG